MRLRWLLVCGMLFGITLKLQAQELHFPVQIIERIDNVEIVAFIEKSDMGEAAIWNPSKAAPPLSVSGAVGALNKHYQQHTIDSGKFTITEIVLRQIPAHQHHWYYLIKVKSVLNDQTKQHYYVVTMGGRVIPAIVEPLPLK